MKSLAFWGGFSAVALGLVVLYLVMRQKMRRLWHSLFGPMGLHSVVSLVTKAGQEPAGPRSVNGLDRFLLPEILKDFPDFDANMAKTYAKSYLKLQLSAHPGLRIHKVVISRYLTSESQKTVVFQAAVCWKEDGSTVQKRFDLHYSYLLPSEDAAIASNCPNCGAALGFGAVTCAYCGSRVVNVMGSTWNFTELTES